MGEGFTQPAPFVAARVREDASANYLVATASRAHNSETNKQRVDERWIRTEVAVGVWGWEVKGDELMFG